MDAATLDRYTVETPRLDHSTEDPCDGIGEKPMYASVEDIPIKEHQAAKFLAEGASPETTRKFYGIGERKMERMLNDRVFTLLINDFRRAKIAEAGDRLDSVRSVQGKSLGVQDKAMNRMSDMLENPDLTPEQAVLIAGKAITIFETLADRDPDRQFVKIERKDTRFIGNIDVTQGATDPMRESRHARMLAIDAEAAPAQIGVSNGSI